MGKYTKNTLDLQIITDLYFKQNLTLAEISTKMGFSCVPRITKLLKDNGYKLKAQGLRRSNNRVCTADFNFFKEINTPNKAYILGLLFADGYVNNKYCKLVLSSKDKDLIELFQRELKSTHKLGEYNVFDNRTNKTYKRYSLQISSIELVRDLNKLGMYNNKSFNCEFPKISENLFWHFIRGLFDGDGTVGKERLKKHGAIRCSIIGSENMLISIKNIFDTMGLTNTKIIYNGYECESGKICTLHYYSYKDLKFIKENMYKNSQGLRLERKYKIFDTLTEYKRGTYDRSHLLKIIYMYDTRGNLLKTYKNINEVILDLNINPRSIYKVLSGNRGHTHSFVFSYEFNPNI